VLEYRQPMQHYGRIMSKNRFDNQKGQENKRPVKAEIFRGQPNGEKIKLFNQPYMEQVIKKQGQLKGRPIQNKGHHKNNSRNKNRLSENFTDG
jgi:hypothetical protein